MKWSYLVKLGLKAGLVLLAVTLLAFSLFDNGATPAQQTGLDVHLHSSQKQLSGRMMTKNRGQSKNSQVRGNYGGKRRISRPRDGKVDESDDSNTDIDNQDIDAGGDNGPYFDSIELENGVDEEHIKNVKYHLRFWDLVNSTKSSDHVLSTLPLFKDKALDYLWRPKGGQKKITEDSYSLVPQIVWQMEAPNSYYAKSFKTKTIVLWDGFKWWSKPSWEDPKQLMSSDCEIAPNSLTQCLFTQRTDDLNSADAVISARDMFHTGAVNVPDNVLKFYFMLESPFHSWALLNRTEDLLATYWRGSDIVTPYAKWVYYDLNTKLNKQGKNYAEGKTKPVAAFISNCDAWNDRMGYINELRKYIQVDVYGSCGELHCSRFGAEDCFGMLKKDYYFYMSFENSNCRDYITEKLYTNGLSNDVVPIVMGAHPEDYQTLAPYKSYIHVEEFDSPKELGEYIHFLIKHPSDYNKYLEWKGTGEFISSSFFCQICALVHYADIVPPPIRRKPYRWGHVKAIESGMCLPKGQWYWTKNNNGKPKTKEKHSPIHMNEEDTSAKLEDVVETLQVNSLYEGS